VTEPLDSTQTDSSGQDTSTVGILGPGLSGADLRIYPNPTQGPISIGFPAAWLGKETELRIFDSAGRVLYQRSWIPMREEEKIDLSDQLPSGYYQLRITNSGQGYGKGLWIR
ncbi:MAG: T9SS type A sorting domain-containing protein, partial [Bacteroidota bacterium]